MISNKSFVNLTAFAYCYSKYKTWHTIVTKPRADTSILAPISIADMFRNCVHSD